MKRIVFLIVMTVGFLGAAQSNTELQKHYEAFYNEMRLQGDVNGVILVLKRTIQIQTYRFK